MSETRKKEGNLEPLPPRPLPNPTYDYQQPATGSFVIRYVDEKDREKAARASAPSLANLKFTSA